uniref:DNA/RNA-binding protein Alba-like domain-containing protein n=1 Tax=Oryza punctata TaxID=4537 RepID=A0A0E0JEP7_ORYPU
MAVEEITEGVRNLAVEGEPAAAAATAGGGGGEGAQRRAAGSSSNRIQVSNTKKPLFFYVNLAKVRYMQQHGDVELSALGMAIATVVTVAEILKNNGFAVEKKIRTSTVEINDESRVRPLQKAKIEIVLGKSEKFDELMAAAAEEREAAEAEEQA